MASFSRYKRDNFADDRKGLASPGAVFYLRNAIRNGNLRIQRTIVTTELDRLDTLAGVLYGDASLWWVLAAASGIGWGLQVPPNTLINVPSLEDVRSLVG